MTTKTNEEINKDLLEALRDATDLLGELEAERGRTLPEIDAFRAAIEKATEEKA